MPPRRIQSLQQSHHGLESLENYQIMAKRPLLQEGEDQLPLKRQRLTTDGFKLSQVAPKVRSARDLHTLLAFQQNVNQLREGVQLFKLFLETIVYPTDEAVIPNHVSFLKAYLDSQKPRDGNDQDAVYMPDIFQTWNYAAEKNEDALFSSTTAVLALLLKTISTRIEFREHGLGICRTVLLPMQLRLLSRGLQALKHKEYVISPCLRLLTELVTFDGGAMARQLYSKRDATFDSKVMARNLTLSKPSSGDPEEDIRKPSVRTNTMRYLLANLKLQNEGVKMDILRQGNVIRVLFDGFRNDPPALLAETLSVLEKNIVDDRNIHRTSKGYLFNGRNLSSLSYLYRASLSEEPLPQTGKNILDLVHEFLLRVCTSEDAGVLKHSTGWYPRRPENETSSDNVDALEGSRTFALDSLDLYGQGKQDVPIRNWPLAELAHYLRPYSNERERELLLAIFAAAPELVADYWFKKVNFSFEPKLTATWIGYSAVLFSSIQLPMPSFLGHKGGYSAHPPPPSIAIESILPFPLNRKVLTKCINHSSSLVTFFGIRIITVAFQKLKEVLDAFLAADSESSSNDWAQAFLTLVSIFTRRCPKMKDVILLFRKIPEESLVQKEAIARLMSLYYTLTPQIALDEKLDISVALAAALQQVEELVDEDENTQLRLLYLSHLVEIAHRSSGVSWWKKPDSLKLSPFVTLLRVHVRSGQVSTNGINHLLRSVVYDAGALQSVTDTPGLDILALSLKEFVSSSPNHVGIFEFIDDCFQRLVRRPIVYEDELDCLLISAGQSVSGPISRLVMTLVEQWPFVEKVRQEHMNEIGHWLARFLGLLKTAGESEVILTLLVQKLKTSSSKSLATVFDKAFNAAQRLPSTKSNGVAPAVQEPILSPTVKFDLSTLAPPNPPSLPNIAKFKTSDVASLLESSSLTNLILCLSSPEFGDRYQAISALQHLMLRLQTSTFPEAVTTYLLLGELVETAQIVSLDSPQPLPYLVTTFASRAVAVLSDPTHAMYPKLAGFLTLRPNWSPLRLVRHLLELVLLQEPSEASDAAHWREVIWLLDWLHDGLRSPADGDILRQVGSWEALGAFGAHPSLGASSARADGEELGAQRLQSRVRGLIVRTLGRALCVGQAATLATRAGGVVWLEIWQAMGWVEDGMAVALREGIVRGGGERVKEWSFGVMDDG